MKFKLLFCGFLISSGIFCNLSISNISNSIHKCVTTNNESFSKFAIGENIGGHINYELNEEDKTIRIISSNDIVGQNIKFKEEVEINEQSYKLESISNNAFANCTSLSGTINFGDSIRVIGINAFSGCSSISGSLVFNENIESIGTSAFANCSEINEVSFLNCNIKSIKDKCFSGCSNLSKVIFSNEIASIGKEVFADCSSLVEINFVKGIEEIGTGAFSNCSSLKNVNLTLTNIKELNNETFSQCASLEYVNLPDQISSIGSSCFYHCTTLGFINLPKELTSIGTCCFNECSSLTRVHFSTKLKTIGDYAFANCLAFGEDYGPIYLPNSLSYIGNEAFLNTKLINNPSTNADNIIYSGEREGYAKWAIGKIDQFNPYSVSIEQGTVGIASGLFLNDYNLTNVLFVDNSLKYICNDAFNACHALTEITIPNSIELIGNHAFANCSELTDLVFNDNFSRNSTCTIGESAFEYCTSLGSGENDQITIPYYVSNIGLYAYNATAYKPNYDGLIYSKKGYGLNCWCMGSQFSYEYPKSELVLKDNTYGIGPNAFRGNQHITKINNIDTVQIISDKAFQDCKELKRIGEGKFPQCLYKVGKDAFIGDESIEDKDLLNLSNTHIETIGDYAFDGCSNISGSISLPNTITSIGKYAFAACDSIDTVNINIASSSIAKIDEGTFDQCINLANINIAEDTLSEISKLMFSKCSSLEQITLPNSIKVINDNAFDNCSNLKNINFNEGLKQISTAAFKDDNNLNTILIPESIDYIGNQSFANCNLSKITFKSNKACYFDEEWIESSILDKCIAKVPTKAKDNYFINNINISSENIKEKDNDDPKHNPSSLLWLWITLPCLLVISSGIALLTIFLNKKKELN